nr:dna repair protein rad13 [Quercus suber]
MGVTGLWEILKPCARPIKIETLNRKRLAVDASIWIYQFLKAVRDKEGNALRNSHVVGFFRRICKLLFFGIKPVFVFDGGAPVLKRQTVMGRKRRREGRREDAVRTAGRLLAVQMQRRAEEEDQRRKEEDKERREGRVHHQQVEEEVPEDLVYVDELYMTQQERQQNRKFKKKDQYHLPELDVSMTEMGGPNDPRVMSLEELQSYARQFDTGEDINVYDFSKIDYDSAFFTSLPASDRYNILNAARLRSRLRMGHSKEQLDSMFPDRMAFSKFQIERVAERNELTQRLMNINDPNGEADFGINGMGRVAGEKGREYVLVKNDGVEGGWALGVVTNEGHVADQPIDLDKPIIAPKEEDESDEDDGFEDVPIEGLNRLPKRQNASSAQDDLNRQRQALYKSRRYGATKRPRRKAKTRDATSLFVADASASEGEGEDGDWEDAGPNSDLFGENDAVEGEDEDLRRAIAMSLDTEEQTESANGSEAALGSDDDMLDVFQQSAVQEARPIPKGSFRAIADELNKRAHKTAPDSHETTSFGVPVPKPDAPSSDDEAMDLQAALAESRRGKRKTATVSRAQLPASEQKKQAVDTSTAVAKKAGFAGPLPFEKLDLGSSLLGKKKMQQRDEEGAGGFVNTELEAKRKDKSEPLPPWFSGDLQKDMDRQKELERAEREKDEASRRQFQFESRGEETLRRNDTREIIDLDDEDDVDNGKTVIDLEENDPEIIDVDDDDQEKPRDDALRMGDMAEAVRVEPPASMLPDQRQANKRGPFQEDDSDEDRPEQDIQISKGSPEQKQHDIQDIESSTPPSPLAVVTEFQDKGDETIDWSESEDGEEADNTNENKVLAEPVGGTFHDMSPHVSTSDPKPVERQAIQDRASRSPSIEFEDIDTSKPVRPHSRTPSSEANDVPIPASGVVQQEDFLLEDVGDEFDDFSDPEEEEMLKALTLEAEEHARFASSLNNKSHAENIAEYEKELKQLRNQQKKDRRDADEVTHVMITECQQLLRLFGLPYVTAPMEAEAQCAELVKLGLVDGIVTDDSDCFLFGGTRVYKNMFNQAKFVECYLTSDLEKEFDLTRDKLIQVAHLLGSDYTEGLSGVGHVTALEILSEFHSLQDFKTWLDGVQMQQITKDMDKDNVFRKKFRKKAMKLILPPSFPDSRVDLAYQNPDIDADPEPFQWGVPDLDALRSFLMATIGWSQERTDEVLVPVIRDMNRRMDEGTQSNITAFFGGGVGIGAAGTNKEAFAPRKREQGSKRLGTALERMAAKAKGKKVAGIPALDEDSALPSATAGDADQDIDGATGRKRRNQASSPADSAETPDDDDDDEASVFEGPKRKRSKKASAKTSKKTKKKTKKKTPTTTDVPDEE